MCGTPQYDEHGRVVGHRIEIDEEAAATIRRIFDESLKGSSYAAIAQMLNRESVPPPRAKSRYRFSRRPLLRSSITATSWPLASSAATTWLPDGKGWVAGTIGAMLLNEAYTGVRSFKKRLWQNVPGTNASMSDRDKGPVRLRWATRRIGTQWPIQSRTAIGHGCQSSLVAESWTLRSSRSVP